MNHLSRLLAMLTILKSKRMTTGPELAEKFGVSLRTIYRDIRKLEASGVPIITIEGRGYSIMDGYVVAPITSRQVEPLAIYSSDEKWIMVAWCRLRDDYRAFRLDRIEAFRVLDEQFADRNFDLGTYFLACRDAEW